MQEYADPVIDWLDAGRGILVQRFFRDVRLPYHSRLESHSKLTRLRLPLVHPQTPTFDRPCSVLLVIFTLSLAHNYPTDHTQRTCPSWKRIFHEFVLWTTRLSVTESTKVG